MNRDAIEAVIADRTAQATDPDVAHAAAFKLEMELRPWFGPRCIPDEAMRRVAAQVLRSAEWIRPAAPACDCSATGGQGLSPTASREHADDCPAAAPAAITDRQLLVDVRQWARANGWHLLWSGWANAAFLNDATVVVDWDEDELFVKRRAEGGMWAAMGLSRRERYPVTSVRQAVDMLVALDVLPSRFSSAYRAAVAG